MAAGRRVATRLEVEIRKAAPAVFGGVPGCSWCSWGGEQRRQEQTPVRPSPLPLSGFRVCMPAGMPDPCDFRRHSRRRRQHRRPLISDDVCPLLPLDARLRCSAVPLSVLAYCCALRHAHRRPRCRHQPLPPASVGSSTGSNGSQSGSTGDGSSTTSAVGSSTGSNSYAASVQGRRNGRLGRWLAAAPAAAAAVVAPPAPTAAGVARAVS